MPRDDNQTSTPPPDGGVQADVRLSDEIIAEEAARGRIVALFTLAGVLTISASLAVAQSISKSVVTADNTAEFLTAIDKHSVAVIAAAALFAIGSALTLPPLLHLAVAARMRRPELPRIVVQLAIAGPLVIALAIPLAAFLYTGAAGDFIGSANHTVKAADDALKGGALTGVRIAAQVGSIAAGFAWIMVGVYSIKIGLLPRLVGSVAVGVGLLTALATNVIPPIVELLKVFELGAIAVLLAGPPEKRPPAWREGRAIPWPSLGSKRPAGDVKRDS